MTQSDILTYLSKYPDSWFDTKTLAKQTNQGLSATKTNMKKLRTPPYFILFKKAPLKHSNNRYTYKFKKSGESFIVENI